MRRNLTCNYAATTWTLSDTNDFRKHGDMALPYLPPGLVTNIAAFLDETTVLKFLVASKAHRQASDRTFLERYFIRRVHLYTPKSLDKLLHIWRSTRLVKRLKAIQIVQPDNGISKNDAYVHWYGPPGNIAW